MGVGVRRDGRETLFVVTEQGVSLKTFGEMLLTLGCYDALNLDAGGSLSLYHQGKTLIAPGRELTNIIVVF